MLVSKKIQCDSLIFMSKIELDGRVELFLSNIKKQIEISNGLQYQNNEEEAD